MASIKDAIAQNQQRIDKMGPTSTAPVPGNVIHEAATPAVTPPPDVTGMGLPVRGLLTPDLVLASDFSNAGRVLKQGVNVRSSVFPYPQAKQLTAKQVTNITTAVAAAGANILLETNGLRNPSQDILNLIAGGTVTLVVGPNGAVTITGIGDGLIHGDRIWELDPAFCLWRDDFNVGGAAAASTAVGNRPVNGELGWDLNLGTSFVVTRSQGAPPNIGFLQIENGTNTTANNYGTLSWPNAGIGAAGIGGAAMAGMPLLDYPSWKMIWTFKFTTQRLDTASLFPIVKKSFYVGLASCNNIALWNPNSVSATSSGPRPPYFVGLRYDTDPGGIALTLTSVATGTGVYQGTITGGTSNGLAGMTFTVAGFSTSANNGTFLCTSSTVTALTLVNPSSSIETHAATATAIGLSDSTFHFDTISNPNFVTNPVVRNNTSAASFNTLVVPTEETCYTFEMTCTVAGAVTMTLRGGGSNISNTFSNIAQAVSVSGQGGATALATQLQQANGLGQLNQTTPGTAQTSNFCLTSGTKITITNSGQTNFNSTFPILWAGTSTIGAVNWMFTLAASTTTSTIGTFKYYPALAPFLGFGNDGQSSSGVMNVAVDFFSLLWNPGVAGLGTATSNPTLSRYF